MVTSKHDFAFQIILRIFALKTYVMQTKLTLTIEQSIIEQAKLYAKDKGRSLSELIENYLKVVLEDNQQKVKLSPSIKKLKGSIKLPDNFDYKKDLTDALSAKYKV
jgi:hypothetical protein